MRCLSASPHEVQLKLIHATAEANLRAHVFTCTQPAKVMCIRVDRFLSSSVFSCVIVSKDGSPTGAK